MSLSSRNDASSIQVNTLLSSSLMTENSMKLFVFSKFRYNLFIYSTSKEPLVYNIRLMKLTKKQREREEKKRKASTKINKQ